MIAIGQLSRGVISVGQLTFGLAAFGQLTIGVLWAGGMAAVAAFAGPGLAVVGFFGHLNKQRLLAWLRRVPQDRVRYSVWRIVLGLAFTAASATGWWAIVRFGPSLSAMPH